MYLSKLVLGSVLSHLFLPDTYSCARAAVRWLITLQPGALPTRSNELTLGLPFSLDFHSANN